MIIRAVLRGERPELTADDLKDVPDGYVALMKQCWQTEPNERPTFKQTMTMLAALSGEHDEGDEGMKEI
jgi:hypothetical protein